MCFELEDLSVFSKREEVRTMQSVLFAIGKPVKLQAGRLTPEEKGEILLKEEIDLDEGVGGKSIFDFNDYFEEFGVDFESLKDFEGPSILGTEVGEIKKRAVILPFNAPRRGDLLLFKRYCISNEEFAARFIFPWSKEELKLERLIPLVFDFGDFCGAEALLVGFFYCHEDISLVLPFLKQELRRIPPERQPLFLQELEAALLEGRLPHGPRLPGKLSFHAALPMEADFEERYEALILETRPEETECHEIEIQTERPFIEE